MNQLNITLPDEIIEEEILYRLPVKSLLKFRCVRKSWLSFIASSRFIKNHLINNSKSNNYATHKTIIYTKDAFINNSVTYYASSFNSILYDPSSSLNVITQIDVPFSAPIVSSIGSCNGLLCVYLHKNRYTIFNPSLRKFRELPPFSDTSDRLARHVWSYGYGFGYDEVSDDYKVIRLVCGFGDNAAENDTDNDPVSKIYSLRNNCWRNINNPPNVSIDRKRGVLVSGKLHWATDGGHNEFISLDMVTEKFGKVSHPKHGYGEGESIEWILLESRGYLYSFARLRKNCYMDVWEMKEYGVKEESWTKLGSILFPSAPHNLLSYPLFVTENGEVLLNTHNSLILYNFESSKNVSCKVYGGKRPFRYFQGYIETLVPTYLDGDSIDFGSSY